jgi:DNA-binding transcriptional ArsR family regulator
VLSEQDVSIALRALADPTRLRIVRDLLRTAGLTVGEVCSQIRGVEKQSSTISHHLKELRLSKLVKVERRGRHMVHSINAVAWGSLINFLEEL